MPFSKDAPPAGPAAPAGVATRPEDPVATAIPAAGFNVQQVAKEIIAQLRAGTGEDPAVADPVMKAEEKIVAQNIPVAGLAKSAAKPADPVREAVKEALLGEDRVGALTKALKACDGDFGLFTRYQGEIGREVVIEDANEMFGGFQTIHNIQAGR